MTQDVLTEFKTMSGSRTLMFLSGHVVNGKVELVFFKSSSIEKPDVKDKAADMFKSFRIYRMEFPGFSFGFDYEEYFSGQDYKKAQLVFDGELKPESCGGKYVYVDGTPKRGMTYAYWVASDDFSPIGPFPVKVRDTQVWWPATTVAERLAGLAEAYPSIVGVEVVGHTVQGRPIKAIRAGHSQKCVALVGALHAGESGPELIIPAIERLLEEDATLLDSISLVAIPELNIDQREMLVEGVPWYLRRNRNGVDLGRNFPADWEKASVAYGMDTLDQFSEIYRGVGPGSEPETQAVMIWLKQERPLALFSFHCLASICGESFSGVEPPPGSMSRSDMRKPAEIYLAGMCPTAPADQAVNLSLISKRSGYLVYWCAKELSLPAYDIEISFEREREALEKCRYDKTDLPLLQEYQKKHFNGIRNLLKKLAKEEAVNTAK